MSRFNTTGHRTKPPVALTTSPITTTTAKPNTRTYEGGAGWTRTPKGELFLMAAGALQDGKCDFYESGKQRDDRLRRLVGQVVAEDPQWIVDFATWLRGPGNIRTAALMIAVDFVHERLAAGATDDGLNRKIVNTVCQRADEPGELLAFWTQEYGRKIPKPVKRGIADAVRRLYNERNLLKYDTASHAYRFGDILNLTHAAPDPDKAWQSDLFKHALDRRYGSAVGIPESLGMLHANFALREDPRLELWLDAERLARAGMTWEDALSAVGSKVDKRELWEALIPSMGFMAALRNLRNFDQAGVSDRVAQQVIAKLTDPHEVARSRQFPFRFLAAYRATNEAGSLRWAYPLEQALNYSLGNVPALKGRTLILVDRSPSMFPAWYRPNDTDKRLGIPRADQAAIFGSALALRAETPTLVEFGGDSRVMTVPRGSSVLPLVEKFGQIAGTDIPTAVKLHYNNHDRVIVVTDEQTRPGYFPSNMRGYGGMPETPIDALVPLNVPVFMWNLAGYTASAMASGSNARFSLGGLTDSAWRLVPMLESGAAGEWPWHMDQGD